MYKKFCLWGGCIAGSFLLLLFLASTIDRLFMPVVTLTKPRQGSISYTYATEATGNPMPDTVITAEEAGTLIHVYVGVGDTVQAGDILCDTTQGSIFAPYDGLVCHISVLEGESYRAEVSLVELMCGEAAISFSVSVSREKGGIYSVGDRVTVTKPQGKSAQTQEAEITHIQLNADLRTYTMTVTLSSAKDYVYGDLYRLDFYKESPSYDTLIPVSLLHSTGDAGTYTFFMATPREKANTYTVTRVTVHTVYEENNLYAAVKWSIPEDCFLVSSTDRSLTDGGIVRTE